MTIRTLVRALACAGFVVAATAASAQETIRLRIASGHPPANTYVNLMQSFFVPEVTKRVATKTKHKVEFVEGYGGAMVKVADTLEGVQSGIIDIGGYCFCFEPSNLPLHAFQVMLPFGTMDPVVSVKLARAIYDKVPYMSKVFEDKFSQHLIALIADNGYNLGTSFEWDKVADLKGRKLAGAGLNLKWLEFAGATPVQSSLPEAYTSMQTGVYNGWIMFPSGYVNFKLYEVGKFYTEIGFGAITWHGLTINNARWAKLPNQLYQAISWSVANHHPAIRADRLADSGPRPVALRGGCNDRTSHGRHVRHEQHAGRCTEQERRLRRRAQPVGQHPGNRSLRCRRRPPRDRCRLVAHDSPRRRRRVRNGDQRLPPVLRRNGRGALTCTDLLRGHGRRHVSLIPLRVTSSGSVMAPWPCSTFGNRPTFAN